MKTLDELLASAHSTGELKVESKVLQNALTAHQEEVNKALQTEVQNVLRTGDAALREQVQMLRAIRQQETNLKTYIDKLDKAFKFFGKTGNPLPLFKAMNRTDLATSFCRKLSIPVPAHDDSAWETK